jgi:prepilin-type N-terminal cleavage/methylation domain-containing protein/prepilin-type processing-associated H-X9-DG protein
MLSHRSDSAFTLLELLVVISIIAVLAAMLLPAIGMVRASARGIRCTAHLRQLPLAVEAYALDCDGQLVLSKYGFGAVQKQWETLLADQVPDVLGGAGKIEDTVVSGNTTKQSIVRGCPDFRIAVDVSVSQALNWTSGYGFNARPLAPVSMYAYNWLWPGNGTQMALVQVTDKSRRIAFGDADDWWLNGMGAGQNWGSVTQPREWQISGNRTSGFVKAGMEGYRRHRGMANYAFFDGHAERLSSAKALDQFLDPANSKGQNTP